MCHFCTKNFQKHPKIAPFDAKSRKFSKKYINFETQFFSKILRWKMIKNGKDDYIELK